LSEFGRPSFFAFIPLQTGKEVQMNWFYKLAKIALIALTLGALVFLPMATAQTQPSTNVTSPQPKEASTGTSNGLHVDITPYIWFAGIHGTAGVLDNDASVHASFGNIFDYLNIGAMGVLEVRYDRVIMPLDFIWMKLSDDKALPINDAQAESVKAKLTETLLTPKIGYRIADGKRVKVDALFGIRYWHLNMDLALQPTQVASGFSRTANWVDGVAGGRFTLALSPKVFAVVAGDAGGGSARLDYQVGGFLGYRISRRWIVEAGYRYLSINYRPHGNIGFVYDVNMPGVAIGATYHIK
jgi:hypothetical protein